MNRVKAAMHNDDDSIAIIEEYLKFIGNKSIMSKQKQLFTNQ